MTLRNLSRRGNWQSYGDFLAAGRILAQLRWKEVWRGPAEADWLLVDKRMSVEHGLDVAIDKGSTSERSNPDPIEQLYEEYDALSRRREPDVKDPDLEAKIASVLQELRERQNAEARRMREVLESRLELPITGGADDLLARARKLTQDHDSAGAPRNKTPKSSDGTSSQT